MIEMVTRKQILKESMDCPILHNWLQYWKSGEISFEQAMMEAIFMLSNINRQHEKLMEEHIKNYSGPIKILIMPPIKVNEICPGCKEPLTKIDLDDCPGRDEKGNFWHNHCWNARDHTTLGGL